MELSEVDASEVKDDIRIVKVLVMGKDDLRTPASIGPYGDDSHPIEEVIALYGSTGEKGDDVIIGYINKNQIAKLGERRLFSTDSKGNVKAFVYLKNDGKLALNGDEHNATRHSPLDSSLSSLVNSINAELTKVAAGLAGVGGVYVPTPLSIDISNAKSDDVQIK